MKFQHIKPAVKDDRGVITDLLVGEQIDAVTLITCKQGAVRGNHYHKHTYQWTYVLSGRMKLLSKREGENESALVLEPGDLALSEPLEHHALIALEDSEILVLSRGPRAGTGFEDDTFRLSSPLQDPA